MMNTDNLKMMKNMDPDMMNNIWFSYKNHFSNNLLVIPDMINMKAN